jgi:23S rRNA (adenine2030-N6)-methyltransferase
MLSYRHAFHAGNAADVLKHSVLIFCLDYMGQKEKPFLCIDTHAGAGSYSLGEGYAAQNREWEAGIGRLLPVGSLDGAAPEPAASALETAPLPPLLCRYTAVMERALKEGGRYPGSPELMGHLIRPQDRCVFFELHPADYTILDDGFRDDRRCTVQQADGLAGLRSLLPPPSRRACVLIDPSYEIKEDYRLVPEAIRAALLRFSTGLYIIWYPLLAPRHEAYAESLMDLYDGSRCRLEVRIDEKRERGMYGNGLVIFNPPYTLRAALEESLPVLAKLLGHPAGNPLGSWDMWWER